jgi:aryl-alcohol dehydrogenase-like predicted oxidoreductase
LLTGWIDANTRFAQGDLRGFTPRFSPENLTHNMRLVELIKSWAARKEAAPAQIALAWLLSRKPWIVPIPGTTKLHRLEENLGAVGITLTAEELHRIDDALSRLRVHGDRYPPALAARVGR